MVFSLVRTNLSGIKSTASRNEVKQKAGNPPDFLVIDVMNWYLRAGDRAMKYRNLPFAPIYPDRAFYVSGDFAELVRILEDVLVGIAGDEDFARAVKRMNGLAADAEDRKDFVGALKRMKRCGPGGDRDEYQQALADLQLAFMGNMYHPGGNSGMRAPMTNENTDVMR